MQILLNPLNIRDFFMKNTKSIIAVAAIFISFAIVGVSEASVHITFKKDTGATVCTADVNADGQNVTTAVGQAASSCGASYELKYWAGWGAHTLERFARQGGWSDCYWMFDVNGVPSMVGMDSKMLNDGDTVDWELHNSENCQLPSAGSTAGEGVVGLINPSTGGYIDTDGDGVSDADEYKNGTDPKTPDGDSQVASAYRSIYMDSDGDGAPDIEERRSGTNPFVEDQKEESKLKIAIKTVKERVSELLELFSSLR